MALGVCCCVDGRPLSMGSPSRDSVHTGPGWWVVKQCLRGYKWPRDGSLCGGDTHWVYQCGIPATQPCGGPCLPAGCDQRPDNHQVSIYPVLPHTSITPLVNCLKWFHLSCYKLLWSVLCHPAGARGSVVTQCEIHSWIFHPLSPGRVHPSLPCLLLTCHIHNSAGWYRTTSLLFVKHHDCQMLLKQGVAKQCPSNTRVKMGLYRTVTCDWPVTHGQCLDALVLLIRWMVYSTPIYLKAHS